MLRKCSPARKICRARTLLPTILFLIFAAPAARAQEFNYSPYQPRTLAEIVNDYNNPDLTADKTQDGSALFGYDFPSRVEVTYTGASRKISPQRKAHVAEWVKSRGLGPEVAELFDSEYLFVEDSAEYWLPVQKQFLPYFEKELKKGDTLALYVFATGGRRLAGKWEWIIVVNEVDKL